MCVLLASEIYATAYSKGGHYQATLMNPVSGQGSNSERKLPALPGKQAGAIEGLPKFAYPGLSLLFFFTSSLEHLGRITA